MTQIQDTTITLTNTTMFTGVSFRDVKFVVDLDFDKPMNIHITHCSFDNCDNIMGVLDKAGAFDRKNHGLQGPEEPRLYLDSSSCTYSAVQTYKPYEGPLLDHELPDGNVCWGPLEPMTSVTDPNPCFMMPAGIIYPIESLVVASGGTIEEEDDLVGDGITNCTNAIQDVIDFNNIDILTGRPKYV